MEIKQKNQKGILLTLATVILFVLMFAELVSYVVLNINYNTIVSTASSVSGGASVSATLSSAVPVFLHQSLQNALSALITYESTPALRYGYFINNTAYALQSLMSTGTIYGTNMQSYMGGTTLAAFLSTMENQTNAKGMNVLITNGTLTVFQSSPFTISANYTALAVVNSTRGLFTFPLVATASVSLNGTPSLYGIEAEDPFIIKPMPGSPTAVLIGNTYATSGNTAYNSFSYGTAVYFASASSCASVPAQYQTANFILVMPNAANMPTTICGMGGLVTYTANGQAPAAPYLIYPSSSNIVNVIQTGTSVLLSSRGKSLLNVSSLKSAIQNGYSFASPYTPSYMDWAQGSLTKRSANGMFSFNLLNRQLASFNGQYSYLVSQSSFPQTSTATIMWWTYVNSINAQGQGIGPNSCQIYEPQSSGSSFSTEFDPCTCVVTGSLTCSGWAVLTAPTSTWVMIAYTINSLVVNSYMYSPGQNAQSSSVMSAAGTTSLALPSVNFYIGSYGGASIYQQLSGKIANVQFYNSVLSSSQIAQLYEEGIDGIPISNSFLIGWWPLNGNSNDYSGSGNNAIPVNIIYTPMNDYQGDSIWGGSLYNANALNANALNLTEGVMNCGTVAQCYNPNLEHLYLANVMLTGTPSTALNESTALGLSNSVLPP
jgi:hypothetical protein